MISNLIYTLDTPERTLFGNLIRSFFSWIITAIYNLIGNTVDLMYRLAAHDYGLTNYIDMVGRNIFNILIIFMVFKLTISIMTYLVNPESFYDKNKGFSGIVKRVIISIALLVSINPIFDLLYDIQEKIVSDDIITTVFTSKEGDTSMYYGDKKVPIYGIKMSPYCNDKLKVYTFSKGDRLALLLFQPFFQPYSKERIADSVAFDYVMNNEESYCGIDIDSGNYNSYKIITGLRSYKESLKDQMPGPNSVDGLMQAKYYNLSIKEARKDGNPTGGFDIDGHGTSSSYFMNFNFIIGLLAGVLCLLIVISFCFDIVIRSFTIILLQILAPVPIISYISPGKSSEMLSKWSKKLLATWVSLFVRIAALSMGISFINMACKNLLNSMNEETLMFQVFVVLGILMFAKKLPQLLEELIPGLKLGGMEINPLKRIRKDAVGGKYISNAAMGLAGLGAAGIGSTLSHLGASAYNKHKIKQERKKIDDINKNSNYRRMQAMQRIQNANGEINAAKRRLNEHSFNKAKQDLANVSRELASIKNQIPKTKDEYEARNAKINELNKKRDAIKEKYFNVDRLRQPEDLRRLQNAQQNYKKEVDAVQAAKIWELTEEEQIKMKEAEDKIQEYKNKKINSHPIRSAVEEISTGMFYGAKNAINVNTDDITKAIKEGFRGTDQAAIKRNYREDFGIKDEIFDKFTNFSRIKNESGTTSEISNAIKQLNNKLNREQNNMVTLSNTLANLTNSLDNSKKPEAINIVNNINHEDFINNYSSYDDYSRKNGSTKLSKEDFDAIYSAIKSSVNSQKAIDAYNKDIKKYTEMKEKQDKKGKG